MPHSCVNNMLIPMIHYTVDVLVFLLLFLHFRPVILLNQIYYVVSKAFVVITQISLLGNHYIFL